MVLTVLPPVCAHCWHPLSFFATKSGEEAQTGPAEYLATLAIMSKGDYSFEAQCLLPGLTAAASAHQVDQSLQDQSITKHHGTKSPLGRLGLSSITEALRHSKPCRERISCRYQVLISVLAAPPNFWPD